MNTLFFDYRWLFSLSTLFLHVDSLILGEVEHILGKRLQNSFDSLELLPLPGHHI